eukprot:m.436109 g.436109  ORF g.436109 m.436109 type:complete len:579 (+) comp17935_c0_seq1:54-1790(+)
MGGQMSRPETPEVPAHIQAPNPEDITAALSSGANPENLNTDVLNVSAIERLSKAANELKGYAEAPNLIELMQVQERTWQEKFIADQKMAEARSEQEKQQLTRIQEEERRKSMEYGMQIEEEKAKRSDQIERQRNADNLRSQQEAYEQERQRNMRAVQEQEAEKRRTMEYQATLDRDTEKIKAQYKGIADAEQERQNKDIRTEQLLLRAEQDRITALEGIREAGKVIGDGVQSFLTDTTKVATTVGIITAIAAGVYGARMGANVTGKYIADKLVKPPLIRDTSRSSWLANPLKSLKKAFSRASGSSLDGIVLKPTLEKRMQDFTISAAHSRKNGATFRNMMLYGPPGTGKTLFASRLAKQSGLDYAILAGGDVAPLGSDAITELHKVFDWAEKSGRGTLLFVDEADSFLRKRGFEGDGQMSENMRNALSTFLYRTGSPSKSVMLVLATNEPYSMDSAILDRIDEAVEFALPGKDERKRLLEQYFRERVVAPEGNAKPIRLGDDVESINWDKIADDIDGFSGRQIMKMATAWQASAYATVDNTLTKDMIFGVLEDQRQQLEKKSVWAKTELKKSKLTLKE